MKKKLNQKVLTQFLYGKREAKKVAGDGKN